MKRPSPCRTRARARVPTSGLPRRRAAPTAATRGSTTSRSTGTATCGARGDTERPTGATGGTGSGGRGRGGRSGDRTGGDDRGDGRGHRDTLDLRHRLKEKHARDFPPEDRGPRSDRYHHDRDRSRGDREHGHGSMKSNRFLEADKHREDRKRDVEEARRQRELLEKEMEIIADKLKRKNKARSRSRSGRRGRKSESGQESGEESENEEISDEEEEDEEESGSGSEAGSGSDATGSQKSEDTPNREDSDDGVIEDDEEDEQLEEAVKAKKSKSRSHTPIEGRWAERSSSAERTRGVYFVWEFLYLPQFFLKPSTIKKNFALRANFC